MADPPPLVAPDAPPSDALLARFLEASPAARTAAGSLAGGVEVAVRFTDVPGEFRFSVEGHRPRLAEGKARAPDFELELAPGAVRAICDRADGDVGDLGILFFQAMLAAEPADKVRAKVRASLLRLATHGWLGVLAHGGPKVFGWLASQGFQGPGAVAAAVARMRR